MTTLTIVELIENFSVFDDWEGRYAYLIDLGRQLEPFDPVDKTERYFVPGCVSKVWMKAVKKGDRWHFTATGESVITQGLIGLALAVYQDKTSEEIAAIDIVSAFEKFGFESHLSVNRRNGFSEMMKRVKLLADKQ